MKKQFLKIFFVLSIIFILFSLSGVKANSISEVNISLEEYTDEYKEWLNLKEEEKQKRLEPRKFNIMPGKDNITYLKSMNNVLKTQELLKANISQNYNLKDIIGENVRIRNQMSTNACWAFATIGALESNLALRNKRASLPIVEYDFSEKHMNYATAKRAFLDSKENEYGYNKKISDGGNIDIATQYLSNGQGAINEKDLPFVDSEENIDISEIQNKRVTATLYDTVEFPAVFVNEKEQIMPKMKEHIVNYGGIYASIHGAQILGDSYNNETGSIYCTNSILQPRNHAVLIIGWDDNYSKDNFNEKQRPKENGAWIIKNSWGEQLTEKISALKEALFEQQQSECEANGWNSAKEIPTEFIVEMYKSVYGESKVKSQGEDLIVEIGNKGYMYISYEDINVYKGLTGIEKATDKKDYDNVYQNDILGMNANMKITSMGNNEYIYLANEFKRDSSNKELLDKVSVYTTQGYTCKVFVNPNGNGKRKEDLKEVKLAEGENISIEPGYHVIEFAEPIKLTGDSFVVSLQIENNTVNYVALETKEEETAWDEAIVNSGESFYTTESNLQKNEWEDIGAKKDIEGNLCIKAYTIADKETIKKELTDIYIEKEPSKKVYTEGENFDKSGMKVMARYSDNSTEEITEYIIIGGEQLTTDKTSVTIQYTREGITKTVTQPITVNKSDKPTEPENPEEPDKNPVSSDFKESKSEVIKTKMYFKSDDLTKATSEIVIKISGIKIGDETNKYEHYYYISGTQGDENIKDWKETKLEKESDGTYSITLNIKSDELKNYSEIIESDNLYVYIKEIAQVNQKEIQNIVEIETVNKSEPECYIDGKFVGTIEDVLNYNKNNNNNTNNENEQKEENKYPFTQLPFAGKVTIGIIFIITIMISSVFAYYRYKNIDR